jgi:dephospho-CoA kinase
VAVSKEQQIKRAMIRSGMTEDEVKARIAAQMSLEDKKKFADVVLDNSGTLEATLEQVHKELEKVLA